MAEHQHLPIYLKTYQFIKFLYGMVRSFPKQYKYTLGENILNLAWRCIDLIIEANSLSNEKKISKNF